MRVIITAVAPDHWGLADRIVHYLTSVGATIAEIQMCDHDAEGVSAVMLRCHWPGTRDTLAELRTRMKHIERESELSIRTWARPEEGQPPRFVLCTTYRPEPALAVLQAIRDGRLHATPVALVGNRPACRQLAEQFDLEWHLIGDDRGVPDNDRLVRIVDEHQADYVVLARYMRVLPASVCWKFAGGRIINLHHGLLPAFPGAQPYRDAFARRRLAYGATIHFIVPELDAGEQIIYQDAFAVAPGTLLEEITRTSEQDHAPRCLVEGLCRVMHGEVELHYHKVVRRTQRRDPCANADPTAFATLAHETEERPASLIAPMIRLGRPPSSDTQRRDFDRPLNQGDDPLAPEYANTDLEADISLVGNDRPREGFGAVRRDWEVHRGKLLLSLADAALLLGALSVCLGFPALLALFLGVIAWVASCQDKKHMLARQMDPNGRTLTGLARRRASAGVVLGLFGAILWLCLLGVFR